MKRGLFLIYSALAYGLGMANIAYVLGFLADFGVPKTINEGPVGPVWLAVSCDVALVLAFGAHHSLTARRSFKRWWTRRVPEAIERSTYLYMTAAMTALLVVLWRPVPITLWRIESPVASVLIVGAFLATAGMMFAASFQFGHLGFFGLRQGWDQYRGRPTSETGFTARYLYALVRHPISLGWILLPWLTPHMTVGQLVFALSATTYVLVATRYEEADLVRGLGRDYLAYRDDVPAFVPGLRRRRRAASTPPHDVRDGQATGA